MIFEYFIPAKTNFLKIKKKFKQGGYQNPKPQESQKTKETQKKLKINQRYTKQKSKTSNYKV